MGQRKDASYAVTWRGFPIESDISSVKKPLTALFALACIWASHMTVQGCGSAPGSAAADSAIPDVDRSMAQIDSVRRIRAAVRKAISESNTYIGYGLAEEDSILRRWQDRTVEMLTYHVGDRKSVV